MTDLKEIIYFKIIYSCHYLIIFVVNSRKKNQELTAGVPDIKRNQSKKPFRLPIN